MTKAELRAQGIGIATPLNSEENMTWTSVAAMAIISSPLDLK